MMADAIFAATAVIIERVTEYVLVLATGRSLAEPWILLSLALYLGAGVFWLPVVWSQMKLRDLATLAGETGTPLPDAYHRYFRIWFAFGIPGFGFTLAILWLMIAKPF
jgi:uncharacterized membrane protein